MFGIFVNRLTNERKEIKSHRQTESICIFFFFWPIQVIDSMQTELGRLNSEREKAAAALDRRAKQVAAADAELKKVIFC